MPKKKRKTGALSAMMKCAAIACGIYEPVNAADVREKLSSAKKDGKDLLSLLEMPNGPCSTLPGTKDGVKAVKELCENGSFDDYVVALRRMTMGYWLGHRVIYHISDAAVDFILNEMSFGHYEVDVGGLFRQVCEVPVFLEFTDEKYKRLNCFCSLTTLFHKEFHKNVLDKENLGLIVFRTNNPPKIGLHAGLTSPLSSFLACSRKENDEAENTIFRVLSYISYLKSMQDSADETLVELQMPSAKCYDVRQIPYEDSLPDFSSPLGLLRGGLCSQFSFLSRQHLLAKMREVQSRIEQDETNGDVSSAAQMLKYVARAVIDWEETRAIYSFDSTIGNTLREKHQRGILLEGLSQDLLSFAPHDTIIIYNTDTIETILISPLDDGTLAIFSVGSENALSIVQVGNPLLGHHWMFSVQPRSILDSYLDALCVLKHILLTYQAKAARVWERADREGGRGQTIQTHVSPPEPSEPPLMRLGEDILPPTLYSVTTKTVRRIPQKELIHKHGWKVIPHVRRGHPHRYWVGRGEEKHMEVRWLKQVKVNASEKQPINSTVIHRVRG